MSRRGSPVLELGSTLRFLPGVGPARAAELAAAGFETVEDLLFHLPVRYEDRRAIARVAELRAPGPVTLAGRLSGLKAVRTGRKRFSVVRGTVSDDTGQLGVVWFNRPYLATQLAPATTYLLHGELKVGERGGRELINPSCERAETALHAARVVAVYPQAGGLGPALFRRLATSLFSPAVTLDLGEDALPPELLARHQLPALPEALRAVHQPDEGADLAALEARQSPAHRRLIYGELLELQLELALARTRQVGAPKRHAYRVDDAVRRVAREVLPFRLTGAQKVVLREIVADLQGPAPMLRLLQGDVGSGKTIVAALAFVVALESGLQGALMAPTELLAEQHFRTLDRLLGHRYRLALLSGRGGAVQEAERRAVASGEVQLAIGTHALIHGGVSFARLGLVVIDEQHRFGVAQRERLESKGDRPDVLVMTATPIPRSLALTAYGDLELSLLDELPPGRLPITTEVLPAAQRAEVYARLRAELEGGAQAYVVFPLIEDSAELEAASVAGVGAEVRALLAGFASAVVHGGLPAEERERALAAFAAGEVRALLATTVIEVGIDVPNATWMVIEGAERFGLAQLHQLRGRVGRGSRPSRCIALHGRLSEEGERRLEVFASLADGFRIAEADLAIRGPGELLGTRQAGLARLQVADLARDHELLLAARHDAQNLLPRLAEPRLAALNQRLTRRLAARDVALAGG